MGTTRRFLRNMDKVTLSNLGKAATLQKVVSSYGYGLCAAAGGGDGSDGYKPC